MFSVQQFGLLNLLVHNFVGACEDLLQALLEPVNIVIDQVLLRNVGLINQAHKGQTLVNLAQVKNDVFEFFAVHVGEANY